uniref:Minor capsid protein P11 C-terminal conserved region domain-containing protein n=1 Tax=viral metagenome TaxID=1070528 RepID=A0A6C0DQ13_9ZZZZ
MFKDIQSGFFKFFTNQRTIILVVFFILAWGILVYSGTKGFNVDHMDTLSSSAVNVAPATVIPQQPPQPPAANAAQPQHANNGALVPTANPSDLLPIDSNSQWSALNPNGMSQGNVIIPDLLQAGYHIGLDTIGQSLRNPNYQLRSDPVIPKADIGPWNMSTIEPDLGRVPLEIGQGPK